MKHIYAIQGMTCNGCRKHVEETFTKVEGVISASVDLEKAEAVVEMEEHVPIDNLENALQHSGGNYHILLKKVLENQDDADSDHSSLQKEHPQDGGMTHTYKVSGMTCNGCRSHVEETLSKIDWVTEVEADLQKGEAVIKMQRQLLLEVFESALQQNGGNYHISAPSSEGKELMSHKYQITGMTCNGCRTHVEETLSKVDGVTKVEVDLQKAEAVITMKRHLPLEKFQEVLEKDGGTYNIGLPGQDISAAPKPKKPKGKGTGTFYCPMHCEGDKTYDKAGDCPVCGMDLVEEVSLKAEEPLYTCPMHPEVKESKPGSCPICGMDLVRMEPEASAEKKSYQKLLKKFKIAVAFTVPIFIIAMGEMIEGNPLYDWMDMKTWNWVQFALSLPVVFYATWMFFERAWRSIVF